MRLNVITAVTRPENLGRVAESLSAAAANVPHEWGIEVRWHWKFDPHRLCVGGQVLKNQMILSVRSGWVWILDDDTLAHPDVLRVVSASITEHTDAIVVSQLTNRRSHP